MKYARPIDTKGQAPVISTGFSIAHPGIDYAYPTGTPIYAAADGTVSMFYDDEQRQWIANTPSDPFRILPQIRRLNNSDYGNMVMITHIDEKNSVSSMLYAHLKYKSIVVKQGQKVVKGQLIGLVGSTGNSTGSHLHFEIRRYGAYVDPNTVIDPSFSNYGQTEVPTPPMTDKRPYWFDLINGVTFKTAWEKLTDSLVNQFVKDYPGQQKRSGEFDKVCRALGLSGDTNIITAEMILAVAKEKYNPDEKTIRQDEHTKTLAAAKQAINRAIDQIA